MNTFKSYKKKLYILYSIERRYKVSSIKNGTIVAGELQKLNQFNY